MAVREQKKITNYYLILKVLTSASQKEIKSAYRQLAKENNINLNRAAMTPEQKLQVALDLYHSAREIKTAGLKSQHPEWTPDTLNQKVREIFLYARA